MNNLKKVVRDPGFQEAALATLSNAGAIVKSVAQIAVAEVATGLAGVMAGTPEIPALSKAAIEAASTLQSDRKSTRLNSSHLGISYAVFCLKKKKQHGRSIAGSAANRRAPYGFRPRAYN